MKYIKTFEEATWWKKYTKYKLSAYPVNIPEEDVEIDLSGDIHSHPVMTWNSPTTGKKVYSYTKERMEAQKAEKYARVEKLSREQVEQMKVACHDILTTDGKDDDEKQAAAIISIISQTGLRPGSKKGFETTKNRGVTTLAVENITIKGSTVKLNFVGKSYHDNTAEFEDGVVANYLANRMKGMKKTAFVFDVSRAEIDKLMKSTKMENVKVKDLRTHIANRIAQDFLEKDPTPPPPVPDAPKEIKKAVKAKLKKAFETVSQKLNNSPAMAKGSYVNPAIISAWLGKLGVVASMVEERGDEEIMVVGNVPIYKMPDWWNSDEHELIKED